MSHWTESIKALEERAAGLESLAQETREAAELLKKMAPQETHKQGPVAPNTATPTRAGKLTRYKGVKIGKRKKDGSPTFEANTRQEGRFKHLGTFETQEEAAAAVADAKGNSEEAMRLRKIANKKSTPQQAAPKPRRHRTLRGLKKDFRGVTAIRGRDKTRYRATAWDSKTKKNLCLGTFDDGLEAALAVAKYVQDGPEIQRISNLIEQKENNPDREKASEPVLTGMVWECRRCGHQHTMTERPEKCENCGHEGLRQIA